jgi:hypothetical protein
MEVAVVKEDVEVVKMEVVAVVVVVIMWLAMRLNASMNDKGYLRTK